MSNQNWFLDFALKTLKVIVPVRYRSLVRQVVSTCTLFLPVLGATIRHFGVKNVKIGLYSASWGEYSLLSTSREVWVSAEMLIASNPSDVEEAKAYLGGPLATEQHWLKAGAIRNEEVASRKHARHEKNLNLVNVDPRAFVLAIGFDDKGNIKLEDGDTRLTILKHHKIREVRAVVVLPVWWDARIRHKQ